MGATTTNPPSMFLFPNVDISSQTYTIEILCSPNLKANQHTGTLLVVKPNQSSSSKSFDRELLIHAPYMNDIIFDVGHNGAYTTSNDNAFGGPINLFAPLNNGDSNWVGDITSLYPNIPATGTQLSILADKQWKKK